jgi:membrane associated rhomboid family serine protease
MYSMTPWVTRLLVANVLVFIASAGATTWVFNNFGWIPALGLQRPWTIITYQFLHAGFMHLLFNMIGLFFFGPRLEDRIGGKHFLGMYLLSGTVGGLLSFITPYSLIVGASGAVFGVLLGFARYWPDERIYIWGVLPIRARVLVIGLAVISIWAGFGGAGGGVAHFAHLGGFVGGWIYLKLLERNSPAERFKRKVEAAQVGSVVPTGRELQRWKEVDASRLHPLNREEYERILGKAESAGVRSLNVQERAFMERVSRSA